MKSLLTPKWQRAGRIGLLAFVVGFCVIFILDRLFPPPLDRLTDLSPVVLDYQGNWVHGFLNKQGNWRLPVTLDDVNPQFLEHLIEIEDKRFYHHAGVDFTAIIRASTNSIRAGRIVSGASTITMQTARLLEPRPRNIGSKLVEMLRALQIEARLDKDEILIAYLTLAPYGGNIQGVRAASLAWFDKEPVHLTLAEQALLIALPQSPEVRRPDRHQARAKATRDRILSKLVDAARVNTQRMAEASQESVPVKRHSFPKAAWHLSHELAHRSRGHRYRAHHNQAHHNQERNGQETTIISTLDVRLQRDAERLLSDALDAEHDGATGAVMIVENTTRKVRALVGSSGRAVPGGWNDLTRAVRSPGSALKPFIYALAFEDGVLSEDTIIDDVPRSFGGYQPENFDRTFRGEVRIREALQHSLNIPAVAALDKIGANRFTGSLSQGGVTLRTAGHQAQEKGLALALGGAGITLRDMATLYTGFASDGVIKPIIFLEPEPAGSKDEAGSENPGTGYQLVSPQVTHKITEILQTAPSLAGRSPTWLTKNTLPIAFKTGTSYGYRDAWVAGYTDHYTIVVWVGRADGAPRPGKTGRKMAAPLLFSLFDRLAQDTQQLPSQEDGVSDAAQASINDDHKDVNLLSINLPPTRRSLTKARSGPQILFPSDGVELFLSPNDQATSFALAARGGQGALRWYVNGTSLARERVGNRTLWSPEAAGFYTLSVVDGTGMQASTTVRVVTGA